MVSILLADDSLTIQKVVELTLSDTGYQLSAVSNGAEALASLAKARPSLVIADVVMPGKNGYEVCEAIKSNPATANIPVILLSGTFEPFDRERAERARANAIVTKPFDSKNLLSQIEALLAAGAEEEPAPQQESFLTQAVPSSPPPAPATTISADTGQFFPEDLQAPEPVTGDIEAAISAYERRESGIVETEEFAPELEVPERAQERAPEPPPPEPPKATVPFPTAPRPEPIPVQPLDFTLEDASPFERAASAESAAPPANEMAVFEEPDNVFEFPANAPPPVPAAAPPPPAEPAPAAAPPSAPPPPPAEETASARPVSPDLERLAQSASISDLASMVNRVAPGASLSEEELDKLSRKVVERLSEKILREIAWEVIPDLAEIEVRRRIREIEAEATRESE
jgi:CheY-like chemotaxis protein